MKTAFDGRVRRKCKKRERNCWWIQKCKRNVKFCGFILYYFFLPFFFCDKKKECENRFEVLLLLQHLPSKCFCCCGLYVICCVGKKTWYDHFENEQLKKEKKWWNTVTEVKPKGKKGRRKFWDEKSTENLGSKNLLIQSVAYLLGRCLSVKKTWLLNCLIFNFLVV